MTAEHGGKSALERTVVQRVVDGLDDDLTPHHGQANLGPLLDGHRLRDVARKQDPEAPTDPSDPPPHRHTVSTTCI